MKEEQYMQYGCYKQMIINAVFELNKKLELNPNDVDLLFNRATLIHDMEDYKEAIEEYEKVLQLDKNKVDCYYYIAHAKKELGDIESHDMYIKKYKELKKNNL